MIDFCKIIFFLFLVKADAAYQLIILYEGGFQTCKCLNVAKIV